MRKYFVAGILILIAASASTISGCSKADVKDEAIATVNGEQIKVDELREFIGFRGGVVAAAAVPVERKKEALNRLIAGRLLAQDARSRGLDNTEDFRGLSRQNEQGVLITALFRKEVASKVKVTKGEVDEEAKKLRVADKSLSEDNASLQAGRMVSEARMRKIEEDLVAAAKKEIPATVSKEALDRIEKGNKVPDDTVLATVAGEKVTYGDVKNLLKGVSGGAHGAQDLSTNPVAINRMLDREATGRMLAAYARKQDIGNSPWMKSARQEMERSVLIDMLAEKEVLKGLAVTDKEIADAYAEHGQMFIKDGKKIPLAAVKDQLRRFIENEKRKARIEAYIGELRKKAKVDVKEEILPKV